MSEYNTYPLQWPPAWKRTTSRKRANFGKRVTVENQSWKPLKRKRHHKIS